MIVFDLCGTLFNSNTTFDFVRFHFKKRAFFIFSVPVRVISKITNKLFGFDLVRTLAIRSIKGLSEAELSEMVEEFYVGYLAGKKNEEVMELFQKFSRDVVIVSASIQPIVKYVSFVLGAKSFIGSELHKVGQCYSGRLSNDLLGNKASFLRGMNIEMVVTDNFSDIDVVLLSDRAVLVAKDEDIGYWLSVKRVQDVILRV